MGEVDGHRPAGYGARSMTTELALKLPAAKRIPGALSILAARLVLFWEQLWPAVLPALVIPFTLIVLSLFDVWQFTPAWLHWAVLALSSGAFAAALWRDLGPVHFPSRRQAQARLEEDGAAAHAPLQALDDTPFENAQSASLLWRAHLEASADRARQAKLKGARPTADQRDPYALRFTAIGLLAVALVAAGDEWQTRLSLGLKPGAGALGGALVADLWIEPPAYTRKAPIYLLRAGGEAIVVADQINAPQGSVLIAQVNGRGRPDLRYAAVDGEEAKVEFDRKASVARAEFTLSDSGLLRLRLLGKDARWPIGVLPDTRPTVRFIEGPNQTDDARVAFTVAIEDDYGVVATQLVMRLDPNQERPLDAPALSEVAFEEARVIDLDEIAGEAGERAAALDLQADPWAGLGVLAQVIVADGAGQTGQTDEIALTLPERSFFNPLARAVLEQRQTLAVAEDDWPRAGRSFDALTMAPEYFFEDMTDYLLLRTAFWRVMRQNGDSYDDAVEKFWPLALQLEDEALELARQRLEAAEEALRQALESGASDKEIARLVEELRQAMNDYLTALAQSGQRMEQSRSQNAQQLDQSDLDEMLDAIRDLAQSGAANAARQMLSDLENMLNNLRLSQGGQGSRGGEGAGGDSDGGPAGKAGELIGRQRELADQSFENGRTPGADGEGLAGEERGLGGDLDTLIDELADGTNADPDGEAARKLGQARNEMRDAEQALRADDFDAATSAMERAIEKLRDGAEDLAREQMRQAQRGRNGEGREGRTDPLGRPDGRASAGDVEVPGESDAGRTRAVIEELRRRLGEQGRSEEEIDYLERLLERF